MRGHSTLFSCKLTPENSRGEFTHFVHLDRRRQCRVVLSLGHTEVVRLTLSVLEREKQKDEVVDCCCNWWVASGAAAAVVAGAEEEEEEEETNVRIWIQRVHEDDNVFIGKEWIQVHGSTTEWFLELGSRQQFLHNYVCPKTNQCTFKLTTEPPPKTTTGRRTLFSSCAAPPFVSPVLQSPTRVS